jgi:hypothetical protein
MGYFIDNIGFYQTLGNKVQRIYDQTSLEIKAKDESLYPNTIVKTVSFFDQERTYFDVNTDIPANIHIITFNPLLIGKYNISKYNGVESAFTGYYFNFDLRYLSAKNKIKSYFINDKYDVTLYTIALLPLELKFQTTATTEISFFFDRSNPISEPMRIAWGDETTSNTQDDQINLHTYSEIGVKSGRINWFENVTSYEKVIMSGCSLVGNIDFTGAIISARTVNLSSNALTSVTFSFFVISDNIYIDLKNNNISEIGALETINSIISANSGYTSAFVRTLDLRNNNISPSFNLVRTIENLESFNWKVLGVVYRRVQGGFRIIQGNNVRTLDIDE